MKGVKTDLNVCSIAIPNKHGAIRSSTEKTTVSDIIEKIRSGYWAKEVEAVRLGTKEKKSLPLALFSGKFSKGTKDEDQVSLSGYVVVDFDYKDNIGKDWQALRKHLSKLPFVASFFTSARGKGVKVIVRVPPNVNKKAVSNQLQLLFQTSGFKIDTSSRAFTTSYVSHDPEALPFRKAEPIPTKDFEELPFELLKMIFSMTFDEFYSRGNGKYFNVKAWSEYTEAQTWRCFKNAGLPKSYKDEALALLARERTLDEIVSTRSGHYAGYYNEGGHRFLVRSSPKLIEARQGAFPNIESLLKSRFLDPNNPKQYLMLIAWLKRARFRLKTYREAYLHGETPKDDVFLPGLIIVGTQGIGKSKVFKNLILPLLGGRKVDGKKILCEASQFNSPLLECEVVAVDDYEATSRFSQGQFAGKLKEVLFSSCVGIEGKFKNENSSALICPIFVQLLNEERIGTIPDYCSIWDKVIFLRADKYTPLEEDDNGDFESLNEAIEHELSAFAYHLDNLELPEDVLPTCGCSTEQRVGMKHYVHPSIKNLLGERDKALALLNEFDTCASSGVSSHYYNKTLSATEIGNIVKNVIAEDPVQIGFLLKSLHEQYPNRVKSVRSGNQNRGWTILPPLK